MAETPTHAQGTRRRDIRVIAGPIRWLRNRSMPVLALTILTLVVQPFFDQPGQRSPRVMIYTFAFIPLFGLVMLGRRPGIVIAAAAANLAAFLAGRPQNVVA